MNVESKEQENVENFDSSNKALPVDKAETKGFDILETFE